MPLCPASGHCPLLSQCLGGAISLTVDPRPRDYLCRARNLLWEDKCSTAAVGVDVGAVVAVMVMVVVVVFFS